MITVSLAYKYVFIAVMLAEINYSAGRLHLKESLPITRDSIAHVSISNPHVLYGGRLDTENYSFTFGKSGRLIFITKLEDGRYQSLGHYRGSLSMKDFMETFALIKATISTNQAYNLATNWLVTMDVDLAGLQNSEHSSVEQQVFQSATHGSISAPLLYVKWGMKVDVMISGINGDLLNLRQEDDSFSRRPGLLIGDVDKLLAIKDEDFLRFTDLEKSNLVAEFSGLACSIRTNEARISESQIKSFAVTNATVSP